VPKLVLVLVGIATRGPRPEGDFLWQTEVKLAESEIIDLCVAEAGTWPACRRRVCDDRRNDVHDLLDASDLERNQYSSLPALGVAVQVVQGRCIIIPVL
jgi:hypothetical protein